MRHGFPSLKTQPLMIFLEEKGGREPFSFFSLFGDVREMRKERRGDIANEMTTIHSKPNLGFSFFFSTNSSFNTSG